jgi:hypothetical protein
MQRVIVTVQRENDAQAPDLDVPAEVESATLAKLIAEALRWDSSGAGGQADYYIEALPLGRTLQPDESLSGAGIWDGALLMFHPINQYDPPTYVDDIAPAPLMSAPPPAYQETLHEPEPELPLSIALPTSPTVSGWRSLGVDLPTADSHSAAEPVPKAEQPASSFVWKQLDD